MALSVVEEVSTIEGNLQRGKIVIESDARPFDAAILELQDGQEARNLAIRVAAQHGMMSPRVNGTAAGAYPVNVQGTPLDQVRGPDGQSLPPRHPLMQPHKYRRDIPVMSPIL